MDRALFLKRLAATTALVAVPPRLLDLLTKPEPYYTLKAVEPHPTGTVTGWWAESGNDSAMAVRLNVTTSARMYGDDPAKSKLRRLNLELRILEPRGGIYVEFHPGKEPVAGELWIEAHTYPGEDYQPVPLAYTGEPGYFVGSNDDLQVFAGVVVRPPS